MQGILLDREARLYRKVVQPDGVTYRPTLIAAAVRCAIVPVSSLDQQVSYAYEATHVVWVDYWRVLRKEDELWWSNRPPDAEGEVQPYIYTIQGRREFGLGIPQSAYYTRELE